MRGAFFVIKLKLKFPLSSGVFPIAVPPLHKFEGTHGDRVAGDNTRCSHRNGHFTYYVTVLCVPATHPNGTVGRYKTSSFDARFSRRLAARVPYSNKHIPLISTLRMSVRKSPLCKFADGGFYLVFELTHSVNK